MTENRTTPSWKAVQAATRAFWGWQWDDPDSNLTSDMARRYAYQHMDKVIRAYLAAEKELQNGQS